MAPQPLVARDAELAAIERFLEQVEVAPRALLLEGEPGIGKTALWRAGVAAARERGLRTLIAQPARSERSLSYSALSDLIADVYDSARPALPAPQRNALDLALLRSSAEGRVDIRTAASGLLSVVEAVAESERVLLAIDDLQWLDRASLRALEYAVRRLDPAVRLLVARREGDTERALGLDGGDVLRVRLEPLSVPALHQLLENRFGAAPPRPTLTRLAAVSGGNPLFALEIAAAAGLDAGENALDRVPVTANMQELLTERIGRLSSEAQEVVLVAASLARPGPALIEAVIESRLDVSKALEEAEAAGVIAVEGSRLRFSHPLVASAVYGAAAGARRHAIHRRLAELATDPEERGVHLAATYAEPDDAVAAAIEAGAEEAARRGAADSAAELFRAAVRLTPTGRAADVCRRATGEGAALLASGDLVNARAVVEAAVDGSPPGPTRAEALFVLGKIAWVDGRTAPATHFERALEEAGDDDRLCGRIHARLAASASVDDGAALGHAERAIELLDEGEDAGILAYVVANSMLHGAQTGLGERPHLLKRALELERLAGEELERSPSVFMIWFQSLDYLDAARERHSYEARWYTERGYEGWQAAMASQLANVELRAGNTARAEELAEESCAVMQQLGAGGAWAMPLTTRARIDAHCGRIERARTTLMAIVADLERIGVDWFAAVALGALGFAELAAGDAAAAASAFARVEAHLDAVKVTCPVAVRIDPDHVEALVQLGELDAAAAVLAQFERRAELFPRIWTRATLPRARALVRAAEGDLRGALAAIEDAQDVTELPFELGRSLLLEGQLQRRLKQRREAAATLEHAKQIFERVGSPPWRQRAEAELERVGATRTPNELTPSERRIAVLSAQGLTNREVAQAAFVSPKTVEANLARVYRKLGIRTRAELGAQLATTTRDDAEPT